MIIDNDYVSDDENDDYNAVGDDDSDDDLNKVKKGFGFCVRPRILLKVLPNFFYVSSLF